MKYLSLLLFAALCLTSCNDFEDEIFELDYTVDIAYEAGISQFQIHSIDTYDIQTMIQERLAATGRTAEEVQKILPKSAQLTNTRTGVSLDFIRNLTLEVFEGSVFTDIKENEIEIFFRDNVPQDRSTQIDIIPSLPDVKEHLLQEKFNFTISTEFRVPPPNTVEARLRLRFSVQ